MSNTPDRDTQPVEVLTSRVFEPGVNGFVQTGGDKRMGDDTRKTEDWRKGPYLPSVTEMETEEGKGGCLEERR